METNGVEALALATPTAAAASAPNPSASVNGWPGVAATSAVWTTLPSLAVRYWLTSLRWASSWTSPSLGVPAKPLDAARARPPRPRERMRPATRPRRPPPPSSSWSDAPPVVVLQVRSGLRAHLEHPAVHRPASPGDIRSLWRGQERDDRGDLTGITRPA